MKERDRARRAAVAAGLALLATLVAQAVVRGPRASTAEPSPAHTAADEREAFLAALGAEARAITRGVPPAGQPVLCVALDPGDAPQSASAEFVQRLAGTASTASRLVRSAECEVRARTTVEIATGARALLLTAGPVEWTAADEALVTVRETRKRGDTLRKEYRVVRENGRWIALGPVWKMSPA